MPTLAAVPCPAHPHIRITDGNVAQDGYSFETQSKESRFEFEELDGNQLSIEVEFHGPTVETSLLGSGTSVSQVALKLRSINQCNLVYVARRFEPKSEIVILIKENKGQSTHKQCKDNGYRRIASVKVPEAKIGESFSLAGSFEMNHLTVRYDGKEVWQGNIPWDFKGESGIRTDNARVSIKLKKHNP